MRNILLNHVIISFYLVFLAIFFSHQLVRRELEVVVQDPEVVVPALHWGLVCEQVLALLLDQALLALLVVLLLVVLLHMIAPVVLVTDMVPLQVPHRHQGMEEVVGLFINNIIRNGALKCNCEENFLGYGYEEFDFYGRRGPAPAARDPYGPPSYDRRGYEPPPYDRYAGDRDRRGPMPPLGGSPYDRRPPPSAEYPPARGGPDYRRRTPPPGPMGDT